ncbi:MAG TPA: PQQ-dependent sugar dehydrogenase [Pyrinomonadaceae bacterium]|nr:PQQ-dependent sugar dehydrogenase [Pyrinomonadaceae bacterium]
MREPAQKLKFELARLILIPSLLAAVCGFILSSSSFLRPVAAFSAGPPAGYTGAPGEEPEACAECHVPPDAGIGHIALTVPQTYVPGQTYPITVTHTNADPSRLRWGFELTVLDTSDEKAGNLQSLDGFTQVLNNQGPGGSRQYIEHTSAGTFAGQQGGASWTFNWTAPATDVGVVLFYAAGNHANNDGNTSGDYIYKTFVASAPASSTPDFDISATPGSRFVTPGGSAEYLVTVTPFAGLTGNVNLSATGLPAGATAVFNPVSVNLTDASSKTSTLTVSTTGATPFGNSTISINGTHGTTTHMTQVGLQVISPSSVDLSLSKAASPNPGQAGATLTYRLTVTNNGPATATNVMVSDPLPSGITFGSATTTQGSCSGTSTVTCGLGNMAAGTMATITIVVTPTTAGQLNNSANVTSTETDFAPANNSAAITTLIQAAAISPVMLDSSLAVRTVVSGLDQPTSMAFIGQNDFFVLEKATGRVQRITNGVLQSTALDLAVNSASERGLLGIALHPQFATNGFVYLFWSESNTGADTTNVDAIAVLGQRVDRYIWNGSSLVFDRNLIRLRALQQDSGQPSRGNHNGGVLRFGPDGKLYALFGDNGRRGFLQNITSGGPVPDDQFGGPEPDDEHMTGIILRLNDDGTTPTDNPFFSVNSGLTGEAAVNVKKLFAYGVRNGFGMAFDHISGNLWTQENGDDAFDEINRVRPGFNGGWTQIMGPVNRIAEFKSIESTYAAGNLQQLRWPPSNIADTAQAALARLYMLPGAQYTEPEFSWKYAVAPSPIGFVRGNTLGQQFDGNMFVGASRTTLMNGYLFRFKMSADRQHFSFSDSRLADLVADNSDKFDLAESESLVIGRDFGITTDIQTGPDGNVYVVSLLSGNVYQIYANNSLQISASSFSVAENVGSAAIVVSRTGNSAGAVTVNYATSDTAGLQECNVVNGVGSSRCDYATTLGTLYFAPGEASKTIFVPIVDDAYAEGNEILTITLTNPSGATLGAMTTATITIQDNETVNGTNPIDGNDFFIRQQYIDFLGREPDPGGLAGWRNVLVNCGITVAPPCDRIEVSAGFFRSEEFQSRGYFIYRFFSALGRIPVSEEFYPDFAKVSGFLTTDQLEANKAAYVNEVMARADFQTKYGSTLNNPTSYVEALLQTVGLPSHPSKQSWINTLTASNTTTTRGQVLRQLVESVEVYNKYYNEAFVIMQYFGYLRRTADASYLSWINTMNQTGGDYRIMINGFMNSAEYRRRFGP